MEGVRKGMTEGMEKGKLETCSSLSTNHLPHAPSRYFPRPMITALLSSLRSPALSGK